MEENEATQTEQETPQDGPAEGFREHIGGIRASGDGETYTVTVMTGDIARDGMIIEPDGLEVDNYNRNPVVLWNHGWDINGRMPIAGASNLRKAKDGNSWLADVRFLEGDSFADRVRNGVKQKVIRAVSIGWRTLERAFRNINGADVMVITRADMTEFSFVGVGSDPGALVNGSRSVFAGISAELIRQVVKEEFEQRFAKLEEALLVQPGTPETAPEDAATSTTEDVAAPSDPVIKTAPAVRHATAEDYAAIALQTLPLINKAVETNIDIITGRI